MGWFDSQIRERERADDDRMSDALVDLSEALTGFGGAGAAGRASADAVADILTYLGASPGRVPADATELPDILDRLVRPRGIMYREVRLTPGWSREAAGPMLAQRTDGTPLALLPGSRGYAYRDHVTGETVRVGRDDMAGIEGRALLFYRPLPSRPLGRRDVYLFLLRSMGSRDVAGIAVAAVAVALLGLALPAASAYVFGPALTDGSLELAPLAVLLCSVVLAQAIIGGVRTLLLGRVGTTVSLQLTAALMMRVLQLPTSFFRDRAAGELASRVLSVPQMVRVVQQMAVTLGLAVVFSVVYLVQIVALAPTLALPALMVTVLELAVCLGVSWWQERVVSSQLTARANRTGWEYALITGIQKMRVAAAERRAFATWAHRYADEVRATYTSFWGQVLPQASVLLGTLVVYACALSSGMGSAAFMSFSAAYGLLGGSIAALGAAASSGVVATPYLDLIEDILAAQPESSERRQSPGRLAGGIELDHVTFSYRDDLPPVIKDLSVRIRPGQYVGIVGRTGCGKSTLLRLLLGFVEPQTGAIYYDGRDLTSLDVRGLRRCIGTVLQDGRLFAGSIYSNIVVSAPWLTLDDAWRAAELAGIADDIRAMPMGMQTMVGEGTGGISGGQRQRILIARAVVASPRILMFDEATSALDNKTQQVVAASLEGLRCTRIAIAHRLSTVRHCDRILVLDQGCIAEDGTYEELMALDGIFAELMRRQQVEC